MSWEGGGRLSRKPFTKAFFFFFLHAHTSLSGSSGIILNAS